MILVCFLFFKNYFYLSVELLRNFLLEILKINNSNPLVRRLKIENWNKMNTTTMRFICSMSVYWKSMHFIPKTSEPLVTVFTSSYDFLIFAQN